MSSEFLKTLTDAISTEKTAAASATTASSLFVAMLNTGKASEALADVLFVRPDRAKDEDGALAFNRIASRLRNAAARAGWVVSFKGEGTVTAAAPKTPKAPKPAAAAVDSSPDWAAVEAALAKVGPHMTVRMPKFPKFRVGAAAPAVTWADVYEAPVLDHRVAGLEADLAAARKRVADLEATLRALAAFERFQAAAVDTARPAAPRKARAPRKSSASTV